LNKGLRHYGCASAGLALILAAGSPACRQSRESGRIDPALTMLVPADTVLLAGVKLDRVRATPAFRKLAQARPDWLEHWKRRTGLEVEDVWEILVASDGSDTIVLSRGRFTAPGALEPRLDFPNASRSSYKGYTLIGTEDAAIVFLNATTAAVAPPASLRRFIDTRGGRTGIPPALQTKLRAMPAKCQAWAVWIGGGRRLPPSLPRQGNLANLDRIFASVETASAMAAASEGIEVEATALARTEQEAVTLHDALRGLLGMARLTMLRNPVAALISDATRVSRKEREVSLATEVNAAALDKLSPNH
jgi:hypothetical protein